MIPDRDVVIVGAGVVGSAIARELTRFDLDVTLLEAGPDVGAGTSKANTALLHNAGSRRGPGPPLLAPGRLAAGNLLHGAEQADVAALSGRHAAAAVARYLDDGEWPARRVPIACEAPIGWIAPNVAVPDAGPPARGRFALRSGQFLRAPRLAIEQDGRALWSGRLARLMPGRSTRVPHGWTAGVDPDGGPVRVRLSRGG